MITKSIQYNQYFKFLIFTFFLFSNFISHSQQVEKKSLSIGEVITFESKILGEERILNIYIPKSYNENNSISYPVIYLLDGSMHEDFLHIVGITQFLSYPWINKVPESIIVGISNKDRKHDFTFPTTIQKDKETFPTTGGSEKFIEFLAQEVKSMIAKNYRINDDATLIGQSLGGLLATEILTKKPALFNRYLIVSPSIWWDGQSLLKKKFTLDANVKIHIAVGREGHVMQRDARNLAKLLKKSDGVNLQNITFEYFKKNNHADILHTAVLYGLEYVYSHDKND